MTELRTTAVGRLWPVALYGGAVVIPLTAFFRSFRCRVRPGASRCALVDKRTVLHFERRRQQVSAELLAQLQFAQLPNGRMRQFVYEDNVIRDPPFGDLALVEREQFIARDLRVLAFDDDEQRPLPPLRMGAGDAGRLRER